MTKRESIQSQFYKWWYRTSDWTNAWGSHLGAYGKIVQCALKAFRKGYELGRKAGKDA